MGLLRMICLLVCMMGVMASAWAATPDVPFTGAWGGALVLPAGSLHLVFHVTRKPDGTLAATLDSPDQQAFGIVITEITLTGDSLHLASSVLGATYDAKRNGDQFDGEFKQGAGSLQLTIKPLTDAEIKDSTPKRPQTPQPPFPYKVENVTFPDADAKKVTLAATFTAPKSHSPAPAVVLISGSGANTRDEEIFGHKLFMVLADYLTRRGIAVLRYDKRGIGKSTGGYATATTMDFADDANAAVAYLKTRKDVDPAHIGLIGHSEGGLIAPIVASKNASVGFIVLMAGPGLTGEQILYRQAALIAKAVGASDADVQNQREVQEQLFAIIKSGADQAEKNRRLEAFVHAEAAKMTPDKLKGAGGEAALLAGQKALLSPWMSFFVTYDPVPTLKLVKCPVLALNGSNDLQVPPEADLAAIHAALQDGGNADFKTMELPGLNHLFQTCTTGSPADYGKIEETMSPGALKIIGDWVTEHSSH